MSRAGSAALVAAALGLFLVSWSLLHHGTFARAQITDSDVPIGVLVDESGRPQGWLSERALAGERVTKDLRSPVEPLLDIDAVLRDALADLLSSESRYGAVVDGQGKFAGVLSLEVIQTFLHAAPAASPTGADLLAE